MIAVTIIYLLQASNLSAAQRFSARYDVSSRKPKISNTNGAASRQSYDVMLDNLQRANQNNSNRQSKNQRSAQTSPSMSPSSVPAQRRKERQSRERAVDGDESQSMTESAVSRLVVRKNIITDIFCKVR